MRGIRFFYLFLGVSFQQVFASPPLHFVNIQEVDASIEVNMAYATSSNFIGRRVNGYNSNNCYLLPKTAQALVRVQAALRAEDTNYRIVVRDCWRPTRATRDFYDWSISESAGIEGSRLTKHQLALFMDNRLFSGALFIPGRLNQYGYLSFASRHSMGNTVDLELKFGRQIVDMGTRFDTFSVHSSTSGVITPLAQSNRKFLRAKMINSGFSGYFREWWHWGYSDSDTDNYYDGTVE